jgi:MFS family permease
VNIALPSAQHALGFSNGGRQWVVTAYAQSFGSLLLLGGRIGDWFSRKWVFITALAGFSVASAIGGASVSFAMQCRVVRAACAASTKTAWRRAGLG